MCLLCARHGAKHLASIMSNSLGRYCQVGMIKPGFEARAVVNECDPCRLGLGARMNRLGGEVCQEEDMI